MARVGPLCVTINFTSLWNTSSCATMQTIDVQVFHQLLEFIVWMISILPYTHISKSPKWIDSRKEWNQMYERTKERAEAIRIHYLRLWWQSTELNKRKKKWLVLYEEMELTTIAIQSIAYDVSTIWNIVHRTYTIENCELTFQNGHSRCRSLSLSLSLLITRSSYKSFLCFILA